MRKRLALIIISISSLAITNAQTIEFLRSAGGPVGSTANGVSTATDAAGNIYAAGNFNGQIELGAVILTSAGSNDFFIAKYSSAGVLLWAKRGGGLSIDNANEIAVSGNAVYITGSFNGTANFNTPSIPGSNEIVSAGGSDIFIAKYNDAGIIQWLRRAGSSSIDGGAGIALSGNSVYITGSFTGTANFNTPSAGGSNEIVSAGSTDTYIAKYNDAGTLQWLRRAGSNSNDGGSGIAVSGNSVYITGSFIGTANFNTPNSPGSNEIVSGGGFDIFTAMFSDAGIFQWARRAGGPFFDAGIGITAYGNSVFITGYYHFYGNFDNEYSPQGQQLFAGTQTNVMVVASYDETGVFQWASDAKSVSLGGHVVFSTASRGNGIAVNANAVYVTGQFLDVANFNTPQSGNSHHVQSDGVNDIFTAKYNHDGNLQWVKRAGNENDDLGLGISVSGSSVYLTGSINNNPNFNTPSSPGTNEINNIGGPNFYLAKLDDDGDFTWGRKADGLIGGTGTDDCTATATDAGGNVYIAGRFERTISFGGTALTSAGLTDMYIAKYNSSGTLLWVRKGNGPDDNTTPISIAVSGTSVYIVGSFSGTTSFNTPSGTIDITAQNTDVFMLKLNDAGSFQWVQRAGGSGADAARSIAVNGSSLYITGFFNGIVDFGTSVSQANGKINANGFSDIFVAKYNDAGELQWARGAGGKESDAGNGIAVSGSSVYVTGSFTDKAVFTNSAAASGSNNGMIVESANYSNNALNQEIFLTKYDDAGNVLWVKRAGSNSFDVSSSVAASGNSVYISGRFAATGDFNNPSAAGSTELSAGGFLAKYNSAGAFQWAKHTAGSISSSSRVVVNGSSVYTAAMFNGTSNFNTPPAPGSNELTAFGTSDIYVAKFNDAGVFQWAKRAGARRFDALGGLAVSGSSIYLSGSFRDTANFNTPYAAGSNELISVGGTDVFLVKYNDDQVAPITNRSLPNAEVLTDKLFKISVFPNPATNYFELLINRTADNYTMKVYDAAGKLIEQRNELPPGSTITFGENYSRGIYIVTIINNKERKTLKVLKQ